MIRGTKLVLGVFALTLALLAGRQALAGNGGNNGSHNNNHGQKPSVQIHFGSGQNHNHNHNHNGNHHHNHGGWQGRPQIVVYCVVVKQPNRYNDWNWHTIKCFSSEYEARSMASMLRSRYHDDNGFAVRIDRRFR